MEMENWIKGVEAKLEAFGLDVETTKGILFELEQKSARRPGGGDNQQSFGDQLAHSDRFKSFQASGYQGSARIQMKAITAAQAGTAWSDRDREVAGFAKQDLRIRDLLTVVPTSSSSVDYARQTARTNNAAPVAEGALKPTSVFTWEETNVPVRTLAHLAKITRQAMDDAAQLAGEVENEMRYGLGKVEEDQLLSGDGTGQNLDGLIPNASDFTAPFTMATPNEIDVIGLAVLQQSLTDFASDGIVVHPSSWMRMRLLKDGDGKYLLGDPGVVVTPRLFGLPVVPSQSMPVGNFLVGGFKLQKLYDRLSPEVLIASENSDDFEHNLYTMRCEERLALAVRQPTALIYGDFTTAITAATEA